MKATKIENKKNEMMNGMKKKLAKTAKQVQTGVKNTVDEIRSDVKATRERDPAARSDAEVLLLYSGVHALAAYRVQDLKLNLFLPLGLTVHEYQFPEVVVHKLVQKRSDMQLLPHLL